MARRRRKSQARRERSRRRVPLWVWLLVGLLIGLGLAAALLLHERGSGRLGPLADPAASAVPASDPGVVPPPQEERQKPRYDFYTLLREREAQVSDQELAERVRAESGAAAPAPGAQQGSAPEAAQREHYLIQAGAFRDLRDADAVKARIALAGLQARIETANVNGITVHRVRLGPYASASELERAKRQLAENGVPDTLAVRESLD